MKKDFIDEISRTLNIERKDLLEKDLILHQLLLDLSKNNFFQGNFLFKGGTCLIKYYLGYFRFSEDLDFTWRDQAIFEKLSFKKSRKLISQYISQVGKDLEEISQKRKMDFQLDKTNRDYVELGGGGKMVTFKLWYPSEILKRRSFLKIQINFVDKIKFKAEKAALKSLLANRNGSEAELLFPELYRECSQLIPSDVYHIKEIAGEKVRAILTRKGIKTRDVLDLFMICSQLGLDFRQIKKEIIEKTIFILNDYEKYQKNFEGKKTVLSADLFSLGAEKELLLMKVDEQKLDLFLQEFMVFLREVITEIEVHQGIRPLNLFSSSPPEVSE